MKKYIIQYGEFSNTYALRYIESGEEIPEGWERITKKEAVQLCRREIERREYNNAFSRYGDATIIPYDYDDYELYIVNDPRYKLVNHIWEKVN